MLRRTAGNTGNTIKGLCIQAARFCDDTQADLFFSVVARFRPPNKAELASGGESIVDFEAEDTCSINVSYVMSAFVKDRQSYVVGTL